MLKVLVLKMLKKNKTMHGNYLLEMQIESKSLIFIVFPQAEQVPKVYKLI